MCAHLLMGSLALAFNQPSKVTPAGHCPPALLLGRTNLSLHNGQWQEQQQTPCLWRQFYRLWKRHIWCLEDLCWSQVYCYQEKWHRHSNSPWMRHRHQFWWEVYKVWDSLKVSGWPCGAPAGLSLTIPNRECKRWIQQNHWDGLSLQHCFVYRKDGKWGVVTESSAAPSGQ